MTALIYTEPIRKAALVMKNHNSTHQSQKTISKKRDKLIFFVKLIITSAICIVILSAVNWRTVVQGLNSANPILLFSVFWLMLLSVTISTYKWQLLLSIHNIHIEFRKLHGYYLTAMFFNNLLPSTIGGDGYRIYKTLDKSTSKSCAVIAVLVERITGLLALLCLGYVGGIVGYISYQDALSKLMVILGTASLGFGIFGLILLYKLNLVSWLLNHKNFPKIIKTLLSRLNDYQKNRKKTIFTIILSFIFQLHSLFFMALTLLAFGQEISMFNLAVAVALTNTIAVLPISINGLGVMEGSFIYLVGRYGVSSELSILTMLTFRAFLIPISLLGGLIYLRERNSN